MLSIYDMEFSYKGFYYIRVIGLKIKHYRFEARGDIQLINKQPIKKQEYERVKEMMNG